MKRRKASVIAAELEALRAELLQLDSFEEPTEEQVTRSGAALGEYDTLHAEHEAAVAHEARIEAIRSAAYAGSTEGGADVDATVRRTGQRGPNVIIKKDPYDATDMVRSGAVPRGDMIERARYAVDQAPKHLNEASRAHIENLILGAGDDEDDNRQGALIARHLLMTGSPTYHQQFREYMRTGFQGDALRASLSLTDANGGYLVPFTLDPTIMLTNAGIQAAIRSISTVRTIATDTWSGVTSAGVTAGWTAEGAEATDGNPTVGQVTITPKRADAWVDGTYEVLADSGFASELQGLLQDAKDRLEGAAFATGNTGATQPRGVIAGVAAVTASIVASGTTNALVAGDVYAVANALRARDAAEASWLASKPIYNRVRQFDTSGGSAFWANLGMGVPSNLLGQPAYESSSMQTAVTTGGLVLLAGNFKQYVIVDRVGMSVQYNPMLIGLTTGRPTGKAGWLAFWRVGADVVDPAAFRLLQLNSVAANVALG